MKNPAVALTAAVLLAGAVASSPTAEVAAATSGDSVLVFRGAAVQAVHVGAAALSDSGAVEVLRGEAVAVPKPPPPYPFAVSKALSPDIQIIGGERIWLVDRAGDRLTACNLRGSTRVGLREIRCRTREIPSSAEGF